MITSTSETWDVEAAEESRAICIGCGRDFTRVALLKYDGRLPERYECSLCRMERADAEFEEACSQ